MKHAVWITVLILFSVNGLSQANQENSWTLVVNRPGRPDQAIAQIPADPDQKITIHRQVDGINVDISLDPGKSFTVFKAVASSDTTTSLYFSLVKKYTDAVPYNFNGKVVSPEIYRQSPHDVNAWIVHDIAMQPIPVVALRDTCGFQVAVCGSPYLYDNYTSQAFYTSEKWVALCSGDNGAAPGLQPDSSSPLNFSYNKEKRQIFTPGRIVSHYQLLSKQQSVTFEGIIFHTSKKDLQGLRMEVNQKVASYFSAGKYKDYFGSLAYTTAFMNLRKNETGKSTFWVVPSVEYANIQYARDAFWISTMLPDSMAISCLDNELDSVNRYAEYPLFTILWAYRMYRQKLLADKVKLQKYLDAVVDRSTNGYYYSYDEHDGRQDFQYWGDVIAFDKDDVIAYNQGLFAVALLAAKEMGLRLTVDPEKALKHYKEMFNERGGFYSISKKKKDILGPDPVLPDLLAILYLHHSLLPDQRIKSHYRKMKLLKTRYGFKVVGRQDGRYLTSTQYNVAGYVAQVNRENFKNGQYFRGGSFLLYDDIFLIDAYLHGVHEAEDELIWRTSLDFSTGATTYECLNTVSGEARKPNMGWNVAVYAIWSALVSQGKASNKLFKHIDQITSFEK